MFCGGFCWIFENNCPGGWGFSTIFLPQVSGFCTFFVPGGGGEEFALSKNFPGGLMVRTGID